MGIDSVALVFVNTGLIVDDRFTTSLKSQSELFLRDKH